MLVMGIIVMIIPDQTVQKPIHTVHKRHQQQSRQQINPGVHIGDITAVDDISHLFKMKNSVQPEYPDPEHRKTEYIEQQIAERRALCVLVVPDACQNDRHAFSDVLSEQDRQCGGHRDRTRGGKRLQNTD